MALITLMSATGSPGVTTATLALAFAWPRPVVLLEADPCGSSQISAGFLRGVIPHHRSVINLADAHRHGQLAEALRDIAIELPRRQADTHQEETETPTDIRLIAGARSPAQALTLERVWAPLEPILKSLERSGIDVIVDAGRLGMRGSPDALFRSADAALLTVRTDLPAVAGMHGWSRQLRTDFDRTGDLTNLGLLLVGERQPYSARKVQTLLKTPVVASLAHDPTSAAVYHSGQPPRRKFASAPLPRSAHVAASAITALITSNRSRLAG